MQTETSDEHALKADSLITEQFRPGPKSRLERLVQPQKQRWASSVTEAGMETDANDEQDPNAP
jgi:hypothetical protein